MDGNDKDEPRCKPSPEPYLGKGKGIDPREFGALEGVDLHELSPEAQVAEYERLARAYQRMKDIAESGTYQTEPRNRKPHKKRSKKRNKKSHKDDDSSSESSSESSSDSSSSDSSDSSSSDSSRNTSEDEHRKSKRRMASQREAERAMAAYKKRGWQRPDVVVVSNNALLRKEHTDGQSQGQERTTI